MKTIFITLMMLLSGAALTHAQDTSSVLKSYSVTVVMKVKDVSSVIPLTPARQVQFAELFKSEMNQQKAIASADSTGALGVQLDIATRQQFQALLSPAEFSTYSASRRGSPYAMRSANRPSGAQQASSKRTSSQRTAITSKP